MSFTRFGCENQQQIDDVIKDTIPKNTKKSHSSVWLQFEQFCQSRNFFVELQHTPEQLNDILKDFAFNMKRIDGQDYKESVVKTMFNVTAKQLQELYLKKFNCVINPFTDITFKEARAARDAKRRLLQGDISKRKTSSVALNEGEYSKMIDVWDENCPSGLQKIFFQIVARELAWRGGEAASCLIHHFSEELDNYGISTGRFQYNPIFSKTCQGGSHKLSDSKWIIQNKENIDVCPVRILKTMLSKRSSKITTDRLFLTPNPFWKKCGADWYKNCPVGVNVISKWTRISAEKAGLDVKRVKITNHSTRSSAVSLLAKAGVGEQQLIKITGHSSAGSIRPYLQMDQEHHARLIEELRTKPSTSTNSVQSSNVSFSKEQKDSTNVYNNCSFNFHCSHANNCL